jgi:hypothetical protein
LNFIFAALGPGWNFHKNLMAGAWICTPSLRPAT